MKNIVAHHHIIPTNNCEQRRECTTDDITDEASLNIGKPRFVFCHLIQNSK